MSRWKTTSKPEPAWSTSPKLSSRERKTGEKFWAETPVSRSCSAGATVKAATPAATAATAPTSAGSARRSAIATATTQASSAVAESASS